MWISLGLTVWIALGVWIVSVGRRVIEIRKESYLAGRMDQARFEKMCEIGTAVGEPYNAPGQIFTQQINDQGITLDLVRLHLPEWDGIDRVGYFSEVL